MRLNVKTDLTGSAAFQLYQRGEMQKKININFGILPPSPMKCLVSVERLEGWRSRM